ncbi:MAG: ABC transporter ATP-binding protein [Anaerolineae bacterium]|nr:ABC transporter ATP-binding protein [Anaerolineae bacterium]
MLTKTLDALRRYQALLITYLQPLGPQVLLLTSMLSGGIALQLINPQILRSFIDQAEAGAASQVLVTRALLFLGLGLSRRALTILTTYVTQDVRWRTTNAMRRDLAAHCLRLDMPFHNSHTPGSIIERIDGDVNVLSNFFSQFVIQILGNAVLLLGVLVLLFVEDWRIGAAFVAFVAVFGMVLAKSVSITSPLWREVRQADSEVYGFLEERLGGTEDIRANGGVAYALRQLVALRRMIYKAFRKAIMTSVALNWGFSDGMLALGSVLALALGGVLYLRGEITIGTVYLIFHYNTMLRWPLNELARQMRDLQSATGSIDRIEELFDMAPVVQEPPADRARTLPAGALALDFAEVNFGYEDEGNVLRGVSWQLPPGEVLGVLGRTGSGKTTMTRLLCRLYDPREGDVRVGDVSLPDVPIADLRQRVGIVTQDVQLFEATVRDNLTMFNDAITDETILDVVDRLGLSPWLDALPEGLDTVLATGSAGLSAGEAQLLAFTRVFLRDPGLVILDEASSRVDPLTERLMERAVDRLFADRTAVIVAHRLATVQRADKILILEDGCITEFGDRVVLATDPASRFSQLLRTGMEEVLV